MELEVMLTDLTEDVPTKFRIHLEYWNTDTDELLDETGDPEDVDGDEVVPDLYGPVQPFESPPDLFGSEEGGFRCGAGAG